MLLACWKAWTRSLGMYQQVGNKFHCNDLWEEHCTIDCTKKMHLFFYAELVYVRYKESFYMFNRWVMCKTALQVI